MYMSFVTYLQHVYRFKIMYRLGIEGKQRHDAGSDRMFNKENFKTVSQTISVGNEYNR